MYEELRSGKVKHLRTSLHYCLIFTLYIHSNQPIPESEQVSTWSVTLQYYALHQRPPKDSHRPHFHPASPHPPYAPTQLTFLVLPRNLRPRPRYPHRRRRNNRLRPHRLHPLRRRRLHRRPSRTSPPHITPPSLHPNRHSTSSAAYASATTSPTVSSWRC